MMNGNPKGQKFDSKKLVTPEFKLTMEKTIKETIQKLFEQKNIRISKIFLFGSRARGNFSFESDWDILVVTEEDLTRKMLLEIAHQIRKELAEKLIPVDVLLKSKQEVEQRKDVVGSVIRTAIKEGIVL
ncbi:MAG: nucleotidyltransferase domain-containing protein [Ignavibacteria bacterium]|nr:nucleotidyltransferase domain-containing protein [Ignavibacteria bacterium]